MNLFLIDGIGPWFQPGGKRRVNWSKIPFDRLPMDPVDRRPVFDQIHADLDGFTGRAVGAGYNAVSLDDVAHLTDHEFHEQSIRGRIQSFRQEFRTAFSIVRAHGAEVFATSDVFSSTPELARRLGRAPERVIGFLADLVDRFLSDFPEVSGVIFRIGECDGVDVKDDFRSELHLRSAAMVNRFLLRMLPVFERHGKRLIFRTWTVGAYSVGDLIWHRSTFAKVLKGIDSPAFTLSMKFGESDFFRYLPVNRNFFRTDLPKIVELQARPEYEGAGEFPSFLGWEHAAIRDQLEGAENMAGISVWCQTGGWHPFRRRTFIDADAVWAEQNARVALRLFRDGVSVEQALREIAPAADQAARLAEFQRLSHDAVRELYYIPDFASQKLFFRRVRIPPLLSVYWDTIFINHSLQRLLQHFIPDGEAVIHQAHGALAKIDRMLELAPGLGLPADDVRFMRDTFEILALAREYYFGGQAEETRERIAEAKRAYKTRWPKSLRPRYRVRLDYSRFWLEPRQLGWAARVAFRNRRGYRLLDHVVTLHLLGLLYRLFRRARPKLVPKFARKRAMGIDAVFR